VIEDIQERFLRKINAILPKTNTSYVNMMDNVLLQIQKDGINAKEFRIVLNNYNKAKNEAAHVNNNQSKITRTIEKRKNINKPYKWEDSLHTSNEG
jgi:hypothetical protein